MRPLVLIDADDTLWENNRFFREAIAHWISWAERHGIAGADALHTLERCEDRNIPSTGYGAAPYVASMRDAYGMLRPSPPPDEERSYEELSRRLESLIRDHEIVLLPGVADALSALAPRADLVVVTKGQVHEQASKLARSGLVAFFREAVVVPEKHPAVYERICRIHGARPADAWMVGNSPRSDVNPARRAGLRTIHVPHPAPWHREEEALIDVGFPTLVASSFADVPSLVFPDA